MSGKVTLNGELFTPNLLNPVILTYLDNHTQLNEKGEYEVYVRRDSSVTITPRCEGYTFTPASRTCTNVTGNIAGADFEVTPNAYIMSGKAVANGEPVAGVTIGCNNDSVLTGADGRYEFTVNRGETVTLTPSLEGHRFIPASHTFENVMVTLTNLNFETVPIPPSRYSIGGKTIFRNYPRAGINIAYGENVLVQSGAGGKYEITVNGGDTVTLTPVLEGHILTPPSRTSENVTGNIDGADFTVKPDTLVIHGKVIAGGEPLAGVTLLYNTIVPATQTDANGEYIITVYYGDNIVIMPEMDGYIFMPEFIPYANIAGHHANQYFVAFPVSDDIKNVSASDFSVYPNPASDELIIDGGQSPLGKVEIYDEAGRHVETHQYDVPKATLDISHLPAGIYFVKAGNSVQKVIVK